MAVCVYEPFSGSGKGGRPGEVGLIPGGECRRSGLGGEIGVIRAVFHQPLESDTVRFRKRIGPGGSATGERCRGGKGAARGLFGDRFVPLANGLPDGMIGALPDRGAWELGRAWRAWRA